MIEQNYSEANRCLLCKVPRCAKACPVNTAVPECMSLYREGRYEEAAAILFKNNPFSAITSQVCDWQKLCMGHCVLNARKEPVRWHDIEQELSTEYLRNVHIEKGESKGRRVAVIGAGPAGISASLWLSEAGIDVTLFDRFERIGGVLRYGIPDFRLDKSYVDEYERLLSEAGVCFRGGEDIDGERFSAIRKEYDAVLVTSGAWKARKLRIPGEDSSNLIYALDYLASPSSYDIKGKVIVVGGGNVTMDACRTALRQGCDTYVYYRKTFENMPANSLEVSEAREEGVKFVLFRVPVEIRNGNIAVMRLCENYTRQDGSVATRMIEGQDEEVSFDTMIVAVSENVDYGIFSVDTPQVDEGGWIVCDDIQQTTLHGVFLAGDFHTGPKTVVHAVASARTAVQGIISLF